MTPLSDFGSHFIANQGSHEIPQSPIRQNIFQGLFAEKILNFGLIFMTQ